MNIQPVNNQPVSDDNDLAKVLSGADGQLPDPAAAAPAEPQKPAPSKEESAKDTPPPELALPLAHEELEGIKRQALEELRPLVDKLDLPAEEKFDILLLIIRSTDDEDLVGKAHETAKAIEDEGRKAQALLDIIKEVDYFANK